MPILHFQLNQKFKTPGGKTVVTPPELLMLNQGPRFQVLISVAQSVADQLVAKGQPIPAPISGWGLIDTGASNTCVDEAVAQKLQLPVIDVVQMTTPSHASVQQNVYPIVLEFLGFNVRLDVPRAMGATLANQGLVALIGRDFLQHCTLFYNGITGQVTLSI
ncbi:MAG TPA: hypothetical protein VGB07_36375 [Blastocatellia bacterium]